MSATAVKVIKILAGLIDGKTDIIKKTTKVVGIAIVSPFITIIIIIGAIFSDGISFNHNISLDLFNGAELSQELLDKCEELKNIQNGLELIDTSIKSYDETLTSGSLNTYQVKGYFIGFMFSEEHLVFDSTMAELWVKSFTAEKSDENVTEVYPTSVNSTIFNHLKDNLSLTLSDDTKKMMEDVYSSLIGNEGGTVTTLSQEEIDKLIERMPTSTSEIRKKLIVQAADAVGKIPYYWGGTASNPGYEGNKFGTSCSPDSSGRAKKGLDCSHFVDWVYWTVMNNNLGNTNTTGQIKMCKKISKSELLPGDLAFLMNKSGQTTHVGIYAGTNEKGDLVWIHENANDKNVAINTVSYWSGYYRLNIMKDK